MTLETHGTGKILILQLMSHFMAKLYEFVTVMNGQRYRVMYHAVNVIVAGYTSGQLPLTLRLWHKGGGDKYQPKIIRPCDCD